MKTALSADFPEPEPRGKLIPLSGVARTLPHSVEAEEFLLACLMLDGGAIMADCLRAGLHDESFYDARRGLIFAVLRDLHRRGQPMDAACVLEELRERKALEAAGGVAYVSDVSARVPTTAQAGYFIAKVRDQAAMRATIRRGAKLVEEVYANSGGARELGEQLEAHAAWVARTLEVLRSNHETPEQLAAAGLARTLAKLEGTMDTSHQLATGLADFDRYFGPFDAVANEDYLIGVGGVTSGFKSTLTRQWALRFSDHGKSGLIFLLETTIGKWLELAACTAMGVNANSLGTLPKDLADAVRAERLRLQGEVGKTLHFCEESLKAELICARIEDHVRRGLPLDYVVIDHLHELNSTVNFRGNRMQELSHIARLFKRTAKRLGLPFFVPMQLNRSPNKDGESRRPTKHDIRDCGEVENACDKLILIYTPKTDKFGNEQDDNSSRVMIELIMAKSRNGRIGWREFWANRNTLAITCLTGAETAALASGAPPAAPKPPAPRGKVSKDQF